MNDAKRLVMAYEIMALFASRQDAGTSYLRLISTTMLIWRED